jgi:ABC-type amino acid transport substrate-binding protein
MVETKILLASIVVVAIIAFAVGYYIYPLVNVPPPEVPEKTIWEIIQERGYIVVATSPDWPPFEFIDPETNEIVGYEVDLMNAIAEKLGLEVQWKPMDFDTIISAVKNREVDLGVSGFSVTPERLEEVLYVMPHIVTEVQLIMTKEHAEELGITRLASLEDVAKYNLVVGTGSGTTQEQELFDLVNKGVLSSDQVRSYADFQAALEDLKVGNIDALYAETPVTTWWIATEPVPLVVVYSRSYWPVAFIANKDASELVEKLNGALAELFASGEIDEIRAKWNVTSGL